MLTSERSLKWFAALTILILAASASAQFGGPPPVDSPQVHQDGRVTFRIRAPKAESVQLSGSDIPDLNRGAAMEKNDEGVWELTLGPIRPGAYRYNFNVDGVTVLDPRNPSTSESNANAWSLVYVPGAAFMDTQKVPHGAVAEIVYFSKTLDRFRRMHIYTPPGYASGKGDYPVFYLLHGAFDCDDSWTTVGRAGFILDNLIAAGKAKPMIVVMPAGHTGPFTFGGGLDRAVNAFIEDFNKEIVPYVQQHYRIRTGPENTAIAGLSMGGAQTLNIAFPDPGRFGYVGVFSSGIFGRGDEAAADWAKQHKDALESDKRKNALKLVWFATGKDDFLIQSSRNTVETLRNHGLDVAFKETEGAHTWIVWRQYLNEFAPQLFKPVAQSPAAQAP